MGHVSILSTYHYLRFFVVYLPPATVSKIGQQFGGKHYLAYHDHYNTENGKVNYIVIPFVSDAERRKETIPRAVIRAILNPAGDG